MKSDLREDHQKWGRAARAPKSIFLIRSLKRKLNSSCWSIFSRNSWFGRTYNEILLKTRQCNKILINTRKYNEILIKARTYDEILINTKEYIEILINTRKYNEILINTKKYNETLIDTMKYKKKSFIYIYIYMNKK